MKLMITWQHGDRTFTYRAAAVIVDQNRVLLHRAETDPYWSLPGGQVEFLEPAANALARELRAKIGAEVAIERLLWVVENFYNQQQHQELGLYFLTHLPAGHRLCHQETFEGFENQPEAPARRLFFQWVPNNAAAFNAIPIVPQFLHQNLTSLPNQVVHITNTYY